MNPQAIKHNSHQNRFLLENIEKPKVAGMGVGKIISTLSFSCSDTLIVDLADSLDQNPEIQAVGIVDKKGKALGIITRKDLFSTLSRPFGRDVLKKKTAENYYLSVDSFNYNENIFTVSEKIAENLKSQETLFFLLVNDKNEFRGIFSSRDMLVFLAEITRQDFALSRKIQSRIVKEQDDYSGKGFSIAASSIMAKGVGGDFYTFKTVSESIHLLMLCDVSGKGMAASLLSSLLSGFINTYPVGTDLPVLIKDLNQQLTKSFEGEKFVTGIFILFNEITGNALVADMGHNHFYYFSKGKPRKIENSIVNIPLGISPEIDVKTYNINITKNDCLLLMTDGMIEQKNSADEFYTTDHITKVFSDHVKASPKEIRALLKENFDSFRNGAARQDDVSFLILKYASETQENPFSDKLSKQSESIEEKIRWSLSSSKPMQIRSSRYLSEDREFIDSILDRYLNAAGLKFLMNKISYCVHELATNAKKANTKRTYFRLKGLDINNAKHYKIGMEDFKKDTLEKIDYYLLQQKKQGYFIVFMFQLTSKTLIISVTNNAEMTSEEKLKINNKLISARKNGTIEEFYDQLEDSSEGAGLGIIMMSQMLKTMGFGPEALTIESQQGLTISSISIRLRE